MEGNWLKIEGWEEAVKISNRMCVIRDCPVVPHTTRYLEHSVSRQRQMTGFHTGKFP